MNDLKIFNNAEFGQIRTIDVDGIPHFVANDVARALGYTNPSKATNDHCKKAVMAWGNDSLGRRQEFKVISEGDMYRLITHSKLESAERFESWVFDEVLPSIRQTGQYQQKPLSPTEQLRLQQQAILEVDEKIEAVDADLQEFKRDMPLLALECQKITWAKNQKVVPLLGGKNAPAYKSDKGSLRSRVYRDLEGQLRREFGVNTYKAIKRSQCNLAIQIIEGYELPMALKEEIEGVNAQVEMFQEVISTQRGSI